MRIEQFLGVYFFTEMEMGRESVLKQVDEEISSPE